MEVTILPTDMFSNGKSYESVCPRVSAIVVNRNNRELLRRCLDSILQLDYCSLEIVVVDNASTDDSVKMVKSTFPNVKLVVNHTNLGFALANLIGFRETTGELIALVNNDVLVDANWLRELVNAITEDKLVAAVGGKMLRNNNPKIILHSWIKLDPVTAIPYLFYDDRPKHLVDYVPASAVVMRRKAIEEIGFFDPYYFSYYEDTDWCARAMASGYSILYVPSAVAWHREASTLGESSSARRFLLLRNRIRFALKHFQLRHLVLFVAVFACETLLSMLYWTCRGNVGCLRVRARAILWNFANLRSIIASRLESREETRSYNSSLPLKDMSKGDSLSRTFQYAVRL